jgi:DNA-binding NtrC family response regulator
MGVLIVEADPELGRLWGDHLARLGIGSRLVGGEEAAIGALSEAPAGVIVIDLDLPGSAAMAVADYAAYRRPEARVIFVTASSFFSDGSLFAISPNAAAFLPARTPPEDLAAVVEFHARRASTKP